MHVYDILVINDDFALKKISLGQNLTTSLTTVFTAVFDMVLMVLGL